MSQTIRRASSGAPWEERYDAVAGSREAADG